MDDYGKGRKGSVRTNEQMPRIGFPVVSGRELPQDTVFEILQNARRREVLSYLRGREGPVDIRDLTVYVAAAENDCPADDLEYNQRKRVHTSLYQSHLPKLADAGLVEYDRRAGTVVATPQAATFEAYLDLDCGDRDESWQRLYLGLGVLSSVAVVLAALEVQPFTSVPGLGYAAVMSILLLVIAVGQVRRTRTARTPPVGAVTETE